LSCLHFCRFLNCVDGGKVPGRSLLDVGVQAALSDAGFDEQGFRERGGIFDWQAPRNELDW
jgi:radical S-adenosyl methionine domain-containing protein 2